ncbi:MAG: hypothetical protein WA891_00360 [Acidobacteriaceae bacterium]|jgi:hypothetical protein
MIKTVGLLSMAFFSVLVSAQSPRSAVGDEAHLWAGGEFSVVKDDWYCSSFDCDSLLLGPAVFFDLNLPRRIGVEGEARWTDWHGATDEKESNLLGGGRYRLFRTPRFDGWGKVLLGGGWLTSPGYPAPGSLKGSYFAFAPGVTIDYALKSRWSLRGDFEYEIWPGFRGIPGYSPTGQYLPHDSALSPSSISVGVSYNILGR